MVLSEGKCKHSIIRKKNFSTKRLLFIIHFLVNRNICKTVVNVKIMTFAEKVKFGVLLVSFNFYTILQLLRTLLKNW